MTERRLTFIDVDENRLELWLKQDRVQLVVIDSRPELEGAELRRFASVVFAEYVGRDLAARLAAARSRLREARERAGSDELAAALDGALRAIDDVAAAVVVPDPPPDPVLDPEPPADREPASAVAPATPATPATPAPAGSQPYRLLASLTSLRPLRPRRGGRGGRGGTRARDGVGLGWGWRRDTGDEVVAAPR